MSPKKKQQPSSAQQDTGDIQEAASRGKRFTSLAALTPFKSSATSVSFDYTHNCHICATTPHSWAITQCNHRCCSTCALRMRALYDNRHCPMCKAESAKVFVCRDEHGVFRESNMVSLAVPGVLYEDGELLRNVESQLLHKCAICLKPQKDKQSLKRHISSDHRQLLCDICVAHKRVFSHELPTFAHHRDLLVHQRGEHPQCAACGATFYGEDELGEHCRQKHELCHICDRARRAVPPPPKNAHQSIDERRQVESERATQLATLSNAPYFADYAALEEHFGRAHFPCTDPLCRELKFVVFADELELRAHQADMHAVVDAGARLQRSQQQQLRRIDISFQRPRVSSRSAPRQEQAVPQAQPEAAGRAARKDDAATVETVFGAVSPSSDIARRMQSLSLLEAQNRDFLCSLRDPPLSLSPGTVSLVQQACREYEAGSITADELVRRLDAWIGHGNLRTAPASSEGASKSKRPALHRGWQPLSSVASSDLPGKATSKGGAVFSRLLELQPDEFKRRELQFALDQHVYKMESFPALEGSLAPKHPMVTGSIKHTGPKMEGKKTSGVLRIRKEEPAKARPATFDAAKSPAWLAGGIGAAHVPPRSTSGRPAPKKAPIKPTRAPTLTGREEASTSIAPARSVLTEEDTFPSLLPSRVQPSSSPFDLDDSTFVIGGEQPSLLLPPASHPDAGREGAARESGTKGSRKKGKLVMSIGIKREER